LGLTLADFDPDAYNRLISGDFDGLLLGPEKNDYGETKAELMSRKSFAVDRFVPGFAEEHDADYYQHKTHAVSESRKRMQAESTKVRKAAHHEIIKFTLGMQTKEGFKAAIISRCGSLIGAWRETFDPEGRNRLTFGEFCHALWCLSLHGNYRALWCELDGPEEPSENSQSQGKGYLTFKDIDPDTDALLVELRERCEKGHKNMLLAWIRTFDPKGTGSVKEDQFQKACTTIGFSGNAKQLYKALLANNKNRGYITLQDFDTKAFIAVSRGDYKCLIEEEPGTGKKKRKEMSFDERNDDAAWHKVRKAWEIAQRDEFAKTCRSGDPFYSKAMDFPDKADDFHVICKRKYGSVISAWRQCLDQEQKGKLSFNEFVHACRRLGCKGDLKKVWEAYARPGEGGFRSQDGLIYLKDLDPEAEELVGVFLMMLAGRYGTIDNAWTVGFNKDLHDSITEEELKQACTALSYPGNAHKLFNCLIPVAGRPFITVWDLDPLCSRRKLRGDTPYIHLPKTPTTHPGRKPIAEDGTEIDLEAQTHNASQFSISGSSWHSAHSAASSNKTRPTSGGLLPKTPPKKSSSSSPKTNQAAK
jgi:hypothetical protein